ncbi:ead/Ea22-like family protein [Salmonella enterica]
MPGPAGEYTVIVKGSLEKHPGWTTCRPVADEVIDKKTMDFIAAANPATMLALLNENIQLQREKDAIEAVALALRDDMRQAREQLEREKPLMVDAMHAAVALNSAGINLNDFDNCVSRLHEWGGLPDYCVALYLDYIHGVVSENKLLDFGYISDNGAFSTRQRIAELEAKLETADRLQDSAFRDGLKAGFSYGQTDDQSGFTQCMSAYSPGAGIKVKGA